MTRNLLALAVLFITVLSSCSTSEQKPAAEPVQKDTTQTATGEAYACPMCPDQKSDKPAKCSMCGMDMVKKS